MVVNARRNQARDLFSNSMSKSFYMTLLGHLCLPILFTPHLLPPVNAVVVGTDDCNDDWVWGECIPWSFDANGCGIDGRQEARREGAGCHIIAFTMKCTPECDSSSNTYMWNFPGFPQPVVNYGNNNNNKSPAPEADYGKVKGPDGKEGGMKPIEPGPGGSSASKEKDTGKGDYKNKNPSKDKGKNDGKNKDKNDDSGAEWGISQLEKPSSGCEYAAPSKWSDCDRNGKKYRSKKLVSGPPICSQVVEEVEECRLNVPDPLNYKPPQLPSKPPSDEKPHSKNNSNKKQNDSTKKQDMKENEEKMPKDEPPSAVGVHSSSMMEKGTTCVYSKFSPWGKCVDGQKSRVQTLRYGPNSCTSQNTEYKRCTKGRHTGCQYIREEKKCDKCSWEKPGFKICRAPLDKNNSKSSCEPTLVIEKPC